MRPINADFVARCRLLRRWLLALEAAELRDPDLTAYVEEAMQRSLGFPPLAGVLVMAPAVLPSVAQ